MEHDYPEQPGWVRLPGYDEDPRYPRGADYPRDYRPGAGTRVSGARRARQASNWTAALLIAGVAAATGYFAHHAAPAAPAAATSVPGGTAATGAHKPSLSAPVATSSGSGVTVGTGPGGTRIVSYRDN
jgi:hypothetical protein